MISSLSEIQAHHYVLYDLEHEVSLVTGAEEETARNFHFSFFFYIYINPKVTVCLAGTSQCPCLTIVGWEICRYRQNYWMVL